MTKEYTISEKLREYLDRKLNDCRHELIKLKLKKKRIQILYISTVVLSIVISTTVVSLMSFVSVPIIVITVLSASSAILTGVIARFNFQIKKVEINNLIDRLHKIQTKLDYVISCNGNLTQTEYEEIFKEFNFLKKGSSVYICK